MKVRVRNKNQEGEGARKGRREGGEKHEKGGRRPSARDSELLRSVQMLR